MTTAKPEDRLGVTGFRELLEAAPDAVVIVSALGLILFVNRQTERLFGRPREDLLGRPIELLVPERFRHAHQGQRAAYFSAPKVRPMAAGLELFGLRQDGEEFPAEISLSPIDTPDGRMAMATIRDVSERRHLAELRRAREETGNRANDPPAARGAEPERRVLRWRELELDPVRHRVFIAGVELSLRPLEFRLATTFLKSPGYAFTRAELLQTVWGTRHDEKTRTVDTHVRRLRGRLGPYGEAIETMHGFGYRWKPEE